jgi:hypothetical protein
MGRAKVKPEPLEDQERDNNAQDAGQCGLHDGRRHKWCYISRLKVNFWISLTQAPSLSLSLGPCQNFGEG